jgi:DNA-binding response OmpR family regulator
VINNIVLHENIEFDIQNHCIYKNREKIMLSAIEFKLLYILATNKGEIFSSEELVRLLEFTNNIGLYIYIRRLREKLESNPSKPEILLNIRKKGYMVKDNISQKLNNSFM